MDFTITKHKDDIPTNNVLVLKKEPMPFGVRHHRLCSALICHGRWSLGQFEEGREQDRITVLGWWVSPLFHQQSHSFLSSFDLAFSLSLSNAYFPYFQLYLPRDVGGWLVNNPPWVNVSAQKKNNNKVRKLPIPQAEDPGAETISPTWLPVGILEFQG